MSLDLDFDQTQDQFNETNFLQRQNQAEKRAHHNALERKRRDHIKGSFTDLRDVVPSLKGEKASRAHVLQAATEFIRTTKIKNAQNRQNIENLKRLNRLFEAQTRFLERIKRTEEFARQVQFQIESNFNATIPATQNLLTNENRSSH